jgi:hypothetical protein
VEEDSLMPSTSNDRIRGVSTSVAVKPPVKAVATTDIAVDGSAVTIDGVTMVTGDRVLCVGQTDKTENGIWEVRSTSAWIRAADWDGNRDVVCGTLVVANNNSDSLYWRVTTADPIVVDTTEVNFEQVAGTVTQAIVGAALWPLTAAESAAGLTDSDIDAWYEPGDVRRYGADGSGDDTTAFNALESVGFKRANLGGLTCNVESYWVDNANGAILTADYENGLIQMDSRDYYQDYRRSAAEAGAMNLPTPQTAKKFGVYKVDANNFYVWRPLGGQFWQRSLLTRTTTGIPFNWSETYLKQVLGWICAQDSGVAYTGDWSVDTGLTDLKSADPAVYISGRARQSPTPGDYVEITYTGGGDLYVVFVGRDSGNYVNVLLDGGTDYLVLPDDGGGNRYFDSYTATDLSYKQIVKIASGVPTGSHTVRLTHSASDNPASSATDRFIFNALAFDTVDVGPWTPQSDPPTWTNGEAVLQYQVRKYNGRYYYATAAGTTGATPPTHSSGTVSDGAVSWTQRDSSGYELTDHRIHAAGSQLEYAYEIKPTGASSYNDVGGAVHGNETQTSYELLVDGVAVNLPSSTWAIGETVTMNEVLEVTHSQTGAAVVVNTKLSRRFARDCVTISHEHTLNTQTIFGYFYAAMWPLLHYSSTGAKYGVQRLYSPGDGWRECSDYYGVNNPFVGRTKDLVMIAEGDAFQPDGVAGVPTAVDPAYKFVAWVKVTPESVKSYQDARRIYASKAMNTSGADVSSGGYSSMTSKMYFERYSNAVPITEASGTIIRCSAQYGLTVERV